MRRRARVDDGGWGFDVVRGRYRLTRAGMLGIALTLVLAAAGTAASALSGRRSPAAANVLTPPPAPVRLSARVSARRVAHGAPVTVSGVLHDAAGTPLAGRVVEILVAPAGDPERATVATARVTGADGLLTATLPLRASADVLLRHAPAGGYAEAVSPPVPVEVAARVTIGARTIRAGGRWTSTLRGRVTPARPGGEVWLERRAGATWRTVATGTLSAASTYAFTVRSATAGRFGYRVVRPADAALVAGQASHELTLSAPRPPRAPGRPAGGGAGGRGTLVVAGDSFAFYLGQQLAHARRPRPTVVESRHSSGLARPDFFDWEAAARAQAATRPGGVVVFLGANDCQPIRVGGTGRWVGVGTPAWVGEYQRRAAALMRTYGGAGARPVVWVGLPIVAKPDVAACYRAVNAATAGAARRVPRVSWVDSWTMYAVRGRYSEVVAGVLARQDDGIHLTFAGTRLLTRRVYALLG